MPPFPFSIDHNDLTRALLSSTILKRDDHSSSISHPSQKSLSPDGARKHHKYEPGKGARPPQSFNNKGFFALFAILGAGMVLTSIWFFFWAKNGGFVWRKRDWDDYKSTVLRRKGKDGKTLSNATPATDLGEKSIAGTFDVERDAHLTGGRDYFKNKKPRRENDNPTRANRSSRPKGHQREPSDEDLRAYRHEKPARVGGLNREQDGSHFDSSAYSESPAPSEVVSNNSRVHLHPKAPPPPKKKTFLERKRERREEKKAEKKVKADKKKGKLRGGAAAAGDEMSEAAGAPGVFAQQHYRRGAHPEEDERFAAYRPPAPPHAPSRRNEVPVPVPRRYPARPFSEATNPQMASSLGHQPQPSMPGSFDAYSDAGSGSSDTGTKVYEHHIPALTRGGVGMAKSRTRDPGFRRSTGGGPGNRRDSLADSEMGDLGGRRRY